MNNILIKTYPQKESWKNGYLQGYNLMKEIGKIFKNEKYPRFVEKYFHDSVVNVLAKRIKKINLILIRLEYLAVKD